MSPSFQCISNSDALLCDPITLVSALLLFISSLGIHKGLAPVFSLMHTHGMPIVVYLEDLLLRGQLVMALLDNVILTVQMLQFS